MYRLIATILLRTYTPVDRAVDTSFLTMVMDVILKDDFSGFAQAKTIKRRAMTMLEDVPPKIVPSIDPNFISVAGKPIGKHDICRAYRTLKNEAAEVLKKMCFGSFPDIVNVNLITDDVHAFEVEPFADRQACDACRSFLMSQMESNPELCMKWLVLSPDGTTQINRLQGSQYIEMYAEYMDIIIALIHLGGGMPARGTELETYRICQGNGNDRSLYWLDGQFYLFARYSKSSSMTGQNRPIARFFDVSLSFLLALDLFVVRPFVEYLANELGINDRQVYRTELFVKHGKKMSDEQIRGSFEKAFRLGCGVAIQFSEYRHVAKHFAKIIKMPLDFLPDSDFHDQAGHSVQTADRHYAIMSTEHRDLRVDRLMKFRDCSSLWHSFLVDVNTVSQTSCPPSARIIQWDNEVQFEGSIRNDRPVLEVKPNLKTSPLSLSQTSKFDFGFDEGHSCLSLDILKRLCANQDASFRSAEQHTVVDYCLWTTRNVLGILPTGMGKSMAFFCFAKKYSNKTIVVVVPTKSLRDDLKRRADQFGISSTSDFSNFGFETILFLLTDDLKPERALPSLCAIAKNNSGAIAKIFVDEAHTFLEDARYRPAMRGLQILSHFGPIVALSATCSPEVVDDLLANVFPPQEDPVIIRQNSNRPNLVYSFVNVDNEAEALELIEDALCNLREHERMIIFCPTKKIAETLSGKLNCPCSHSQLEDEERMDNSQAWFDGSVRILCATSGFGTGVDYPHVRRIFMWGPPYSISAYAQQSGRAGRDGLPSIVTCFTGPAFMKRSISNISTMDKDQMSSFVESTACRRRLLCRFLEETETSCLLSNSIFCDNCEKAIGDKKGGRALDVSFPDLDEMDPVLDAILTEQLSNQSSLQKPSNPRSLHDVVPTSSHGLERFRDMTSFYADLKTYAQRFKKTESGQECLLCFVNDKRALKHDKSYYRCRHLYGKCFQCACEKKLKDGHVCGKELPKGSFPQCVFCWFPAECHLEGDNMNSKHCKLVGPIEALIVYYGHEDITRFEEEKKQKNDKIGESFGEKVKKPDNITKLPMVLTQFVDLCKATSSAIRTQQTLKIKI